MQLYSLLRVALVAACLALTGVLLPGCDAFPDPNAAAPAGTADAQASAPSRGRIVVANRGAASLSLIDTRTHAVTTVPMPDAGEPMYVVYTPARHRVFVGDRANDRVVAFDARTFEVDGAVPAGAGVFHMWADPQSQQLWVVDNVGNALTVIDPKRLTVLATIPVAGGVPHDVIVDPRGRFAFATVFVAGGADQVVQYSTRTFAEVGRTDVGEDPHLSLNRQSRRLWVPTQGSDAVVVLDQETLAEVASIDVPNAHGAGMPRNGRVFYTTNISDGGADGLFVLDTRTNVVIGSADTPFPTPHNLALTPNGRTLYVTHSGAASDQVSVCTMSRRDPVPDCAESVTVGLNPFGLAFVP